MDLMSIYAALETPAGAQLVSNHGELTLLVVRHDHEHAVCIERYPLGATIDVTLVIKLIDSVGLTPREPEPPVPVTVETAPVAKRKPGPKPKPARPPAATADATEACPDCDKRFVPGFRFKMHQIRAKHGSYAPGAPQPDPAPPVLPAKVNPDVCDLCGAAWRGQLRCDDCNALIGLGHTTERVAVTHGSRPLCGTCARRRRLIPNAAAISA